MKRRPSADAFFLIAVLLVFAVLSFQISARSPGDRSEEETNPRRSTYSARPGGWKAFYEVLQESGLPVQRWTRSPGSWSDDVPVVICGPEYGFSSGGGTSWSDHEAEQATNWVEGGGTLVVLTDRENALTDALHLKLEKNSGPSSISGNAAASASFAPRQPLPLLNGVRSLSLPDGAYWSQSPGKAVRIFGDAKPAALIFSRGDGTVVAVSSSAIADNRHLGAASNARFLVQTVAAFCTKPGKNQKPAPILFDEFHQGYNEEETLWSAIGAPGQRIAYELLVLALLIAYTASRRFGLPSPLPAASRVSSEYVRSLASLYQRARAADAALESLYNTFRRDLSRALGVPADTPAAEMAPVAAASLASGDKDVERRLHQLMDTCEAKISGGPRAVADTELLPLARSLESLRKELQLG